MSGSSYNFAEEAAMTIELPLETEEALKAQASAHGVSADAYVREMFLLLA